MKKIIVLGMDGSAQVLDEDKLTSQLIDFSSYALIPINDVNRSYVCVKPSKYMTFTKAHIQYQMCAVYYDDDDATFEAAELFDLVDIETSSLCDVYGLLNSIDRLHEVNYVMNGGDFNYDLDTTISVALQTFNIILFDEDTIIYQKSYVRNGTTTIPYDPYAVTKHFKKIYDIGVVSEMYISQEKLGLRKKKKGKQSWKLDGTWDESDLIGVPCINTNTILFLTQHEYRVLLGIKRTHVIALVFYSRTDRYSQLCEGIACGQIGTVQEAQELMEEVYIDQTVHLSTPHNPDAPESDFVELLAMTSFIFPMMQLVFNTVYGPPSHHPSDEFEFDAVLQFEITLRDTDQMFTLLMNSCSMMGVTDVLESIYSRKEGG